MNKLMEKFVCLSGIGLSVPIEWKPMNSFSKPNEHRLAFAGNESLLRLPYKALVLREEWPAICSKMDQQLAVDFEKLLMVQKKGIMLDRVRLRTNCHAYWTESRWQLESIRHLRTRLAAHVAPTVAASPPAGFTEEQLKQLQQLIQAAIAPLQERISCIEEHQAKNNN